MLSFLALISDWVCFSTASSPRTFEAVYNHNAEFLIDIFLYSNVFSCFFVTDTVLKLGMEKSIKGAASLMLFGCLLRSEGYISSLFNMGDGVTPYNVVVLGTILVGFAQPFFQCTPPMLSAIWFGSKERALSTAVALNANQIGIATAFLIGGSMCHGTDSASMMSYFGLITVACAAVTATTLVGFKEKPPLPPSGSEAKKLALNEKEPPFFQSAKQLLSNKDFYPPLAAFVASITITNIVGAFIDEVMERGGILEQQAINVAGAGENERSREDREQWSVGINVLYNSLLSPSLSVTPSLIAQFKPSNATPFTTRFSHCRV
jgi:MFS transporter, FLVCR family, MFS-domain-containing protein 7